MIGKKSYLIKTWLLVFIYIVVFGLLFQLVILPCFFPGWHAGDGLLKNGDWNEFHKLALSLLSEMEADGWAAWQLRPREQAPAGLAAAVYKITGIAKPWVLVPLNAIIHSSSTIILMLIINSIATSSRNLIFPVLPFVFFPTALLWNIQFHKDGIFILGSFLFLYSLLSLTKINDQSNLFISIKSFLLFLNGIFLIWIVRPYGVEMVFYIGLVLTFIILISLIVDPHKEQGQFYKIGFIILAFVIVFPFISSGIHHQYVLVEYQDIIADDVRQDTTKDKIDNRNSLVDKEKNTDKAILNFHSGKNKTLDSSLNNGSGTEEWLPSTVLPTFIDENIYKMSALRDRYIEHKPEAGSNVDDHISFSSSGEAVRYIPRALQIGLLAPFPNQWFASGTTAVTTLMRRVIALEMVIIYISLLGTLIGCWCWRRKLNYFITIGFTIGMILTYSMVVPNIGTLHRMRYGFLMILVALGIAILREVLFKQKSIEKINSHF